MAKTKLTLTIDETLIETAKRIVKYNNVSLSEVITNYLKSYTQAHNHEQTPSVSSQLRGVAKSKLSDKTDRQIKEMMYKDKYNL
jgi:Family of unknown function (DUF6364)